jgi:hypothetical protein
MKASSVTLWVKGSAWRVEQRKNGYRSQLINGDGRWHPGIPPGTRQSQVDDSFKRLPRSAD